MKFSQKLIKAKFIKRYKRFLVDLNLEGEIITAHSANTGSMTSCFTENCDCLLSQNDDPKRKLKFSLEMTKPESDWVGVNTGLPNLLVSELFESGQISDWKQFDRHTREIKINDKSRIDLVLWNSKNFSGKKPSVAEIDNSKDLYFIEVKNVSLKIGEGAYFPDAVSVRAQKHLEELIHLVEKGHKAEILFCVQRSDCNYFSPAREIDPVYAKLLAKAEQKGVVIRALKAKLSSKEIVLTVDELPLRWT